MACCGASNAGEGEQLAPLGSPPLLLEPLPDPVPVLGAVRPLRKGTD